MFDYSKLKGRIVEKGYTQQKLCDGIGITQNSMTNKLKGKSDFSSQEIAQICNMLDIEPKMIGSYFFVPIV